MLVVKHPADAEAEDEKLKSILKKAHFAPHAVAWAQAYKDYRQAKGDPWQLEAVAFTPSIRQQQLDLYETRRNGGPLRRIRATKGLKNCPMCGSPTIGTLDHYLPKDSFPEFSVMPSNLLPTCSMCNSGGKGRIFKGTAPGERFLHPYYDTVGSGAIWRVLVNAPYKAATFTAVPEPSLPHQQASTMSFHLQNVLGLAFLTHAETYWDALPEDLATVMRDQDVDASEAWQRELKTATRTMGLNGWRTALLRGVIADSAARSYVEGLAADK